MRFRMTVHSCLLFKLLPIVDAAPDLEGDEGDDGEAIKEEDGLDIAIQVSRCCRE